MKKGIIVLLILTIVVNVVVLGKIWSDKQSQGNVPSTESSQMTEPETSTEQLTEQTTESIPVTESAPETEAATEVVEGTEIATETEQKEPEKVDISTPIKPAKVIKVKTEGSVSSSSLKDHGKEIRIYGELDEDSEEMKELAELLANYDKNISMAIWKKDGTAAFTYNTKQGYFSACTIKAGYILYCCKQIEKGKADADQLLTYEEKHWHDGSGKIKNEEFGTQYTIRYLIQQALYISDNVAYEMLYDHFGMSGYNKMVDKMGCETLKPSPTIWAYSVRATDYIVMWEAIYEYFETETEMANLFYSSCKNTPFNYGTRTLKVDYNHKSGDNFGKYASYHDAGIVWSKDDTYIYAIFTNSEGEVSDEKTVDRAMELAHAMMKK